MYINKHNIDRTDVISYIKGNDIYNSQLIKHIKDADVDWNNYYTILSDRRSDIISQNVYGDGKLESFIMLLNHDFQDDGKSDYKVANSIDEILGVAEL